MSEGDEQVRSASRRPRPMWMRFLAVNAPLVMLCAILFYTLFELNALNIARDRMAEKLDRFAQDQSRVLSRAVWTLDRERVAVILDAVVNEPDVIAARVTDNFGEEVASVGDATGADPDLMRRQAIQFRDSRDERTVGHLMIAASDARLLEEFTGRITRDVMLLFLLLVAAIVSAAIAFRRTIGAPLKKLMAALEADDGQSMDRVEWRSDDEMGEVIAAFNRMRMRQRRFERELRDARADLERRVEQRTYELAVARDEAEAANMAKSRFLANMSHELRTPLNAVIGFSEVMISEMFGPLGDRRYKGYSEDIRKSGEHLLALINDILDLSKVEAGKWNLSDETVDLEKVAGDALVLISPSDAGSADTPGRDLDIRTEIAPDLPAVQADARAIKQVLVNLLSNAVKFTPSGGRVTVRLSRAEDGGVAMTVSDTGIGIPAGQLDSVIQPFSQGDSTMSRAEQGTGLGLSLVKALTELHGGSVGIESVEGEGTTVTVHLPPERVVTAERGDPVKQPAAAAGE